MEAPRSPNRIAQIWKYFVMQVVLGLPFPLNPFTATVYIQTRDCGTACQNSYCLCVVTTKKRRGEGSFKRFFSHRGERIFLVQEKERELSSKQLSLFKYSSSVWGGGVGNVPSWPSIPMEASLKFRSTCVEIFLELLDFPSVKERTR